MPRSTITRQTLHNARAASTLAKARPAYAAGFRAAIATVAPLLASQWLGIEGGTWMSLAGLNGALIDRGGAYRMRALTLVALTLASAAVAVIAALLSGHAVLAIIVTFAVAFLCGLARAWPHVGTGFGVTVLVTFAISLAVPSPSSAAALARGGYIIIGGVWALVLALIVWPLRPYRPVRLSVAACYDALSDYLQAISNTLREGRSHDIWDFKDNLVAVRTAIEAARTAVALSRRGRSAETRRGERLLILQELSDQLYAHLIALMDIVETVAAYPPELIETLDRVTETTRGIARGVESEHDLPHISVPWNGDALRHAPTVSDRTIADAAATLLDRMAEFATAATATLSTLNSGQATSRADDPLDASELTPPHTPLFSIGAIVRADSVVVQHALRVSIVTTVAVLVTELFHLNHGYWVTLTAVVILQPYAGATTQKALQRVLGTILGGIVAAALSAAFQNSGAVLVLIAVFTSLCVALLPINYGAYAVFGTPAFVLLAESSAGDWHLAGLRIVNTLIGGALALIGSRLLWHGGEWNRLPEYAAAALRANRDFLRLAVDHVDGGHAAPPGALRDTRRRFALAASNAEESFQRLVGEHAGPADRLEPVMAFLVYARRFAASTAALALAGGAERPSSDSALLPFATAAEQILDDLAAALAEGRRPRAFPAIGSVAMPDQRTPAVARSRVNRLARQLRVLHDAVDRWSAANSSVRQALK